MHIYFSGIGGVGIGPLVQIARDAGYTVSGSDTTESLMTTQLAAQGVDVVLNQDGTRIAQLHSDQPIDWFVHTAALANDNAELVFARGKGIRTSKRDELLAEIIRDKQLKLIAVSGTHGKTTTTGLLIWAFKQLGMPVSYSVGSQLSFGPSGQFDPESTYFVYECDEFDRNMLHFEPHLTLITSLGYDHSDTYATPEEYRQAFVAFLEQSTYSLLWEKDVRYLQTDPRADLEAYNELMNLSHITLAGDHVRHNAYLVERALQRVIETAPADVFADSFSDDSAFPAERPKTNDQLAGRGSEAKDVSENVGRNGLNIINALNSFPGTARRFEKLADNLYSDYGHHPVEIAATLQLARELSDHVVLVYQPHQNIRQHEVRSQYTDCMELAETVYWLPTYLSREDPSLEVLTPTQLSESLTNRSSVCVADLDDELWSHITDHLKSGKLVLFMGAGNIDAWLRSRLNT